MHSPNGGAELISNSNVDLRGLTKANVSRAGWLRGDYVSKTDIYAYRRCPYTFHLVESGQISREEAYSPIEGSLMADGISFEDGLLEEMPTTSRRLDDPKLREEAEYIYGVETIFDHDRKLIGRPDGFDLSAHAPIEVKHRLRPDPMDRLELAFYWMLLEPLRASKGVEPYGWLDLMGGRRLERVKLLPSHFAKVNALIEDVRRARRNGIQPLPCQCFVCADRSEVQAVYAAASDVGLILNIKSSRAEVLRSVGITTVAGFADADPTELARLTKAAAGPTLSAKFIANAQPHARALRDNAPVWLTEDRLQHDGFIALDLEYISGLQSFWGGSASENEIFAVGALSQRGEERELVQAICNTPAELREALRSVAALLRKHKTLPVYTWNGESADLRYLDRAARRHDVSIMSGLTKRHVDLLLYMRRVVRLPIVGQDLKSLGRFLNVARDGDVTGGFAAVALYYDMRAARGNRRKVLAQQLLRYNENDLIALTAAATFFETRRQP
jgi:predicted RecB family nuclease